MIVSVRWLAPVIAVCLAALPAAAATGPSTTRVSVDSFGKQADGGSGYPAVSADGRYVAFASAAKNLVAGDTNGAVDIFVHDRRSRATTRVSLSSTGAQATGGHSSAPAISADGRYVVFESQATNLVDGDTNGSWDVFVHDRETRQTVRADVSSTGEQASLPDARFCGDVSISADGRYAAFSCEAANLVGGDTNNREDVFVRDLKEQKTTRVSVASNGSQASDGDSHSPSISADGRRVAFASGATDLVANDGNNAFDIFVRNLTDGTTVRASVNSSGGETSMGAHSLGPALSADGFHVAFWSAADNLVTGDTNLARDVFVRELQRGQTARVNVERNGTEFSGLLQSGFPAISSDGRFVAFEVQNVPRPQVPPSPSVLVKDIQTGALSFANVDSDGFLRVDIAGLLALPAISATGRFVTFGSGDTGLVPSDTNGMPDIFVRDTGANTAPVVVFSATPGQGVGALELSVDATESTDPDGWIGSYSWTFGQGGTATGPKGVFRYPAPGTYTVALTVTDNDGAISTASKVVTIEATPTSPPPSGVCTIKGTRRADVLRGTPRRDRICGLGGNDRIDGRGGNDVLEGGAGNDVITGGFGRDTLRGGPGNDRIAARDGIADVVDGGSGRDTATIDRGRDRVRNVEVSK